MTLHLRCPLCGEAMSRRRGVQGDWLVCWGGCKRADVLAYIANLKPEQLRLPLDLADPPRRSAYEP